MSDLDDLENEKHEKVSDMIGEDGLGLDDPEELEQEDDDLTGDGESDMARADRLERELAETKDRMLRLAADLENTRRRALKEKSEATQYGIRSFAGDLLSVADNFQRALEAVGDTDRELSAEALAGIINGIRMTEKELLTVFERNGIKRIYPEGEKFDPHLHQAIAHVPGNGLPEGHVVNVAQPGFTLGDRVLRAAMVTVSSGA